MRAHLRRGSWMKYGSPSINSILGWLVAALCTISPHTDRGLDTGGCDGKGRDHVPSCLAAWLPLHGYHSTADVSFRRFSIGFNSAAKCLACVGSFARI